MLAAPTDDHVPVLPDIWRCFHRTPEEVKVVPSAMLCPSLFTPPHKLTTLNPESLQCE
jgi:hypothetical protein